MRILLSVCVYLFCFSSAFAADFTLKSSAFEDNQTIPKAYTCHNQNISPPLSWANAPDKTVSFALILSDPDAPKGTWYHWVVYNIPSTTLAFPENITELPPGTELGLNSYKKKSYNGPCPPIGNPHHYIFTLYALDSKLDFTKKVDANELQQAMEGHILKSATLTGLFSKF